MANGRSERYGPHAAFLRTINDGPGQLHRTDDGIRTELCDGVAVKWRCRFREVQASPRCAPAVRRQGYFRIVPRDFHNRLKPFAKFGNHTAHADAKATCKREAKHNTSELYLGERL
jgi:hypothetical protein